MLRLAELSREHQLETFAVAHNDREMRVFAKPGASSLCRSTLRVYLEGDGRPWIWGGRQVADNPNSSSLTGLRLMLRDPGPALYLSRPCYGFDEVPSSCSPEDWTSGRYSEAIVASMDGALTQLKRRYSAQKIELLGFSGGGTLAVLLAARRADVVRVVTLAANLDHRRWTEHFNYLPLDTSLNARNYLPLRRGIERWHHVAAKDTKVPPLTSREALAFDRGAEVVTHPDYDHNCCWEEAWPALLNAMSMTPTKEDCQVFTESCLN